MASDLRRARETAHIVAGGVGLEPTWDARLRERDLGTWSGLTTPEIAGRWPAELARLRARDPDLRPGGGESIRMVTARLRTLLCELASRPAHGRIALVTHGGVMRALGAPGPIANAVCVPSTLGALLEAVEAAARPPSAVDRGDLDGERV